MAHRVERRASRRMTSMPRLGKAVDLILGTVAVVSGCGAPVASPGSIEATRTELLGLITDVTQSTAYRYKLIDDQGRHIGPIRRSPGRSATRH